MYFIMGSAIQWCKKIVLFVSQVSFSAFFFWSNFCYSKVPNNIVFENLKKSLILQHCERSEHQNAKNDQFGEFLKTVLPDMSISKGQKLAKNAKIENSNATF